jgi:hypothetical protein
MLTSPSQADSAVASVSSSAPKNQARCRAALAARQRISAASIAVEEIRNAFPAAALHYLQELQRYPNNPHASRGLCHVR